MLKLFFGHEQLVIIKQFIIKTISTMLYPIVNFNVNMNLLSLQGTYTSSLFVNILLNTIFIFF